MSFVNIESNLLIKNYFKKEKPVLQSKKDIDYNKHISFSKDKN
jgi:hypothetical protein